MSIHPDLKTYDEFIKHYEQDTEANKALLYKNYVFARKEAARKKAQYQRRKEKLRKEREALPPEQRPKPGRPRKQTKEEVLQKELETMKTELETTRSLLEEKKQEPEPKPEVKPEPTPKVSSLVSYKRIFGSPQEDRSLEQSYPKIIQDSKVRRQAIPKGKTTPSIL